MSLTFVLNREKDRINLKNWLRFHFPNPKLNIQKDILVKNSSLGNSAGEIGTAFDYLFRFNLERTNKIKVQENDCWVAENGYNAILNNINLNKGINIIIGYKKDKVVNRLSFKKLIKEEFSNAKKNHKKFIKDGLLTNELIKSSIILAKLDLVIRISRIDANFDSIEIDKILELEELFYNVPWEIFKTTEYCFLNPSFGKGSELVGRADADIIIGDTLIDIKTNREFKVERQDLNQIIGYYLLSILGKLDIQIKNIGIYYARYGYLWKIPLTDFYELDRLSSLAEEFKQLIENKNLNLLSDDNYKSINNLNFKGYIIDKNDFKCPRCESKNYIKNGTKGEKFRYKCKDCKIGFTSSIEPNSTKNKAIMIFDYEKELLSLEKDLELGIFTLEEYEIEKKRIILFGKK